MKIRMLGLCIFAAALCACSTLGRVGVMALYNNPGFKVGKYKEIGLADPKTGKVPQVEGSTCRCIWFGLIPSGDSDVSQALVKSLEKSRDADALVDVTVKTSLYHYVFPYSVLTISCVTVKGTPVQFWE